MYPDNEKQTQMNLDTFISATTNDERVVSNTKVPSHLGLNRNPFCVRNRTLLF